MIHYLIVEMCCKTIVAGFIATDFETITAHFTISFAREVYTAGENGSTNTHHSSTEKCYLKPTGHLGKENRRLSHTSIMAPYCALPIALHVFL